MTTTETPSRGALHIEPPFQPWLGAHGLLTVNDWFDDHRLSELGAERLDKPGLDGWRSRLRLRMPAQDRNEAPTLYVKRFDHPPASSRREVVRACNGARTLAGVEWIWIHRLAHDGIPCATPVALGEDLHSRREIRSVLVTQEVPGQSLERWAASWSATDRPAIDALLDPLADLIARFHGCGYVHRDLYLAHVFCSGLGDGPNASRAPDLRLIDLQRVLKPGLRAQRYIIKDLASLNYSSPYPLVGRRDRVRWLKRYLGVTQLDAVARRMIYRIEGKTRQIARHDARRNARHNNRSAHP